MGNALVLEHHTSRTIRCGNIGEPKRIIEFEPLEEPAPVEVPEAPRVPERAPS